MPRVLRILNRFNLGGPTYNAAYLTKYLQPDFETMLVGGMKDDSEGSSEFIAENLGIDYQVIPEMRRALNLVNDRIAFRKLKQLMREFKPDIVHTHAAKAGGLGRMAAISAKVPVIVHTFHGHVFHSYFGKARSHAFKQIERKLAKRSTAIIAISKQQKHELTNVYRICPPEKVSIIPLGFDLDRFRKSTEEKRKQFRDKYKLEDTELAIGIIGRLVPVKNHQLFLETFKKVQSQTTQKIRGFIIGDGELRKELELVTDELQLDQSSMTFTSWIRDVDIAYAGLDIVVLTSFNEGTPVSLIEAQAAGKPIVATKVGGIGNVVIEQQTALLSNIDNPESLSENLLNLIENKELRQNMEQTGWGHVKAKFHYTRLVKDMGELYHSLLDK